MLYGTAEGVFRSIITAGWNVKSDGDVEANTGHFAIVEIPEHEGERNQMRDAVFLDELDPAEVFDTIQAGWYFVVENSQGNVSFVQAKNEADAYRLFQTAEAEYAEWVGSDES
jgi:hypothetical protein